MNDHDDTNGSTMEDQSMGLGELFDRLEVMECALMKIATGEGYYGVMAREYKNIAREALGMPTIGEY